MNDSNLLRGQRLYLSTMSREDARDISEWEHDTEFLRLLDASPAQARSIEQIVNWLDTDNKSRNDFLFGIRLLENDELIGWAELDGVQWTHQTASVGIGIGNRIYWSQGFGGEAMQIILRFAFDELNLHSIHLTVFSYNARAIRLYEKLGFTHEGTYRECLQRDGQRYDMLLYGLLRPEWEAQQVNIY